MKHRAVWTDDCSGKKNFDCPVVSISTSYWPLGGGFYIHDEKGFRPSIEDHPGSKPSATASICLDMEGDDYEEVIKCTFEGETFDEVAAQVEVWAQTQFERIVAAVRKEFSKP